MKLPSLRPIFSRFKSLRRRASSLRRTFAIFALLILAVAGPGAYLLLRNPSNSQAAWFDNNWGFRQRISFTNSGSAVINQKVKFDIDTATLITAGQLQSNCQDLRFTDISGKVLQYFIDTAGGACNTSSTDVYVLFPSIIAGENIAYMYYGNPSVSAGTVAAQFSQTTFSPGAGPSFASAETGATPSAYWKFDDGTGTTTKDSSPTNSTGTLTNIAATPTGDSGWQTENMCVSGKCLKFDGTNDYVTMSDNSALEPSAALSINVWIKRTGANGTRQIFLGKGSLSSAPNTSYWLELNTSNQLRFELGYNSGASQATLLATDKTITDNNWHHVVATWNGTTMRLYLDGSASSVTATASGTLTNTTQNFSIGQGGTVGSLFFNGFIDEAKIYPYARSAAQVKTDFIQGASSIGSSSVQGFQPQSALSNGLTGYWKLDETTSGASRIDSSGNSYTLTDHNTVAATGGKFANGGGFTAASSQYVDITDTNGPNLSVNSADIQMSAWVKLTSTATQTIVSKYASSGAGEYRLIYNGGFEFRVNGDQGVVSATNFGAASIGTWYFVTAWYNRSTQTINIQVNDKAPNSAVYNAVVLTRNTSANFMIGAFATSSPQQFANATIDEVRVYKRLLSATEINQLYNWGPGPIGYWNFDEKTGSTVNDRSGNDFTATWNGTLGSQWGAGKYGAGGNFNGTDNYVSTASTSTLGPGNNGSISLWYKPPILPAGTHNLISFGGSSYAAGYLINQIGAGLNFYWLSSGPSIDLQASTIFTTNSWYHIEFVNDNGSLKAYVNGVLRGTGTSGGAINSSRVTYIGGAPSVSWFTTGIIDDVRVYNYPRTPAQVIEDMRGASGGVVSTVGGSATATQPGSAYTYWKLDEGGGTTTSNSGSSARSFNGTLTSMAAPATSTSGWNNAGKVNKALSFDGTDDYVATGNPGTMKTFPVSLSTWIKTSSSAFQTIYSEGYLSSTQEYERVYVSNTGIIVIGAEAGGASLVVNGTKNVRDGAWHHVAVVHNSTTDHRIYVDGKLDATSTTAFTPSTLINSSAIGRLERSLPIQYFLGQIDEVKVFPFGLTLDQVRTEYNLGLSTNYGVGATTEDGADLISGAGNAPVGEWLFEEKTGTTANDTSGNNNTGTLTSGPTWTTGKVGTALNFDGVDDYVTAADSASLSPTTAMSISLWINPSTTLNSSSTRKDIVYKLSSYYILFNFSTSDGKISFITADTANQQVKSTTTSWSANTWYHIEGTYDGTTLKIYVNGILENSATDAGDIDDSANALTLGSNGATNPFPGKIDQVKIYNYARSNDQVAYDYNRGGPIVWYKMDECQGTVLGDASGIGNPGTLTIGPLGTQSQAGTCNTSSTSRGNGATGKFNSSINFDGTDDYAALNSYNGFSLGEMSISVWQFATANVGNLFDLGSPRTTGSRQGSNEMRFTTGSGLLDTTGAQMSSLNNTWVHHVYICSRIQNIRRIYINGILRGSDTNGSQCSTTTPSGVFALGSRFSLDNSFITGKLDDFRIYNYPVSPAQVKKLYNNGLGAFYGPSTGAP